MRQDRESCCPSVYVYIHANSACSQLCLILREERLACYALVGSAIFRWVGGSGQDPTLVTRPSSFPFYHALLYARAILTPMPQVQSVYNARAVQHVHSIQGLKPVHEGSSCLASCMCFRLERKRPRKKMYKE